MLDFLNLWLFGLPLLIRLCVIFIFMAVLGIIAVAGKHLKISGAVAAVLCGSIILFCTRVEGFLLFCIFYVSCNIVGKLFRNNGHAVEKKGSTRDWIQVCANGLMSTIAALYYFWTSDDKALIMFASCIAESCADTWAGEIGKHSKREPVSLRTFKIVEKGTSGGVTVLGFSASLLASVMIAMFYSLFFGFKVSHLLAIVVSAFLGCAVDSFLGATCQALYKDENGRFTEKETDELVRGARWIDNDTVNFLANVFTSVLSMVLIFG